MQAPNDVSLGCWLNWMKYGKTQSEIGKQKLFGTAFLQRVSTVEPGWNHLACPSENAVIVARLPSPKGQEASLIATLLDEAERRNLKTGKHQSAHFPWFPGGTARSSRCGCAGCIGDCRACGIAN